MPLHRAPTEFGKNTTLRISAGPKRPKFFLFNVPALPPKIVPGQVGVLPAQRRQVSQHAVVFSLPASHKACVARSKYTVFHSTMAEVTRFKPLAR